MKKLIALVLALALTSSFANMIFSKDAANGKDVKLRQQGTLVAPTTTREVVWSESFETSVPPADWTLNSTNTVTWQQDEIVTLSTSTGGTIDVIPVDGTYQAHCGWDYSAQDEWLISDTFECPENGMFSFWTHITYGSTHLDHYYIKLSTDGGTTWTELWDATAQPAGENNYDEAVELDLSSYAGENIQVALQAVDGDSQGLWFHWFVDHLQVTGEQGGSGDPLFTEDFEAGNTDQWTLEGPALNGWTLMTSTYHSPDHSLAESENNYASDTEYIATIVDPLDLSNIAGAELNFWIKHDIEEGFFDFLWVEVSTNGTDWIEIDEIFGEGYDWYEKTLSLGAFCGAGNETVWFRYRFLSDGGYEVDGFYLDDITVNETEDIYPPLILFPDAPEFYEGTPVAYEFEAELIDPSGVATAKAVYTVEGGAEEETMSTGNVGNIYTFEIPAQAHGDQVDFKLVVTDNEGNEGETAMHSYISGAHVIQDNGQVDFYTVFDTAANGSAQNGGAIYVQSPGEFKNLVYALIRNYADSSQPPNGDMEFHVWADDFGFPGADLITPMIVTPEATPQNNSPMTRIDLREYADDELADLESFFFGFMPVDTEVKCTISDPGNFAGSSFAYTDGQGWALFLNQSQEEVDYHWRAVMSNGVGIGDESTVAETVELSQNYPNPFNPTTSINFTLPKEAFVNLTVYNVHGQKVANLVNDQVTAGMHTVNFDGAAMTSGVYYYTIKVNNSKVTKKMMLVK